MINFFFVFQLKSFVKSGEIAICAINGKLENLTMKQKKTIQSNERNKCTSKQVQEESIISYCRRIGRNHIIHMLVTWYGFR